MGHPDPRFHHAHLPRKSLSSERWILAALTLTWDLPGGSDSKESACNAGGWCSTPGSRRSPGEGNGNPSNILAWEIPWTEEPGGL